MLSKKTLLVSALLLWVAGVTSGFVVILRYEGTAGDVGQVPPHLPREDPRNGTKLLIMLAHPHCPCSTASLAALEQIMARWHGRIEARVYVLQPDRFPANWSHNGFWHAAAALPGVQVYVDANGQKAKELGARTSGHVVLFDENGRLLFSGGITGARGHQGDNPGCQTVLRLLKGETSALQEFPVFGCSLFDSPSTCSEGCSLCPN